jgi:hypothetical protein
MKYLISFFLFLLSLSVSAQKGTAFHLAKAKFDSLYPKADSVKWDTLKEKDGMEFYVTFKQDNNHGSGSFDDDGNLIRTKMILPGSTLPAKMINYLKEKYPKMVIKSAFYFTNSDYTNSFLVTICSNRNENCDNAAHIYFDKEGNFMRYDPGR